MGLLKSVSKKFATLGASLVLMLAQLSPMAAIFIYIQPAVALPACVNDQQGANDSGVPGEKDLTRACIDTASGFQVSWSWDRVDFGPLGGNTGDACSLFDTDGDGKANTAVCVSVDGDPGVQISGSPYIYTCNDSRFDRCAGDVLVTGPYVTTCSVSTTATQPFGVGEGTPNDTTATCNVNLAEVGSGTFIDACSYPSSQVNSNPFDCIVLKPGQSKIEVKKVLSPTNDSGLFNLLIDSTNYAANVGNNGTTGDRSVADADHTVSETAGTGTSLSDYTSSIICKDANGTGAVIAQNANGTSVVIDKNNIDESDVLCVITNTRKSGTITLVKSVTNDNGGTATVNQFGLTIGGTSVTSGQTLTLTPGSYAINEAGLAGYQFVSITGTGCPTVRGGNVVLANGQNITCTITNNDIAPQLTVIKHVINDNGGTAVAANFEMQVTGTNVSDTAFPGVETTGTTVTLNAGAFSVAESGPGGYGAILSNDCGYSIAVGEHKTCTITNNDIAPSLTLNKIVNNNYGGTQAESAWTLTATGPTTFSGAGALGATDVVSEASFDAGTYTLSESAGPSGYMASKWTCSNGITVSEITSQITLAIGQNTVCTITNSDVAPKLTVTKIVSNANGGSLEVSDFSLYVGQQVVVSGVQNTFSAGTVTVSETPVTGYVGVISGDCNPTTGGLTMVIGGVYNCTITNTSQPGTLIVKKVLVKNNGASETVGDFSYKVNGGESVDFEDDGQNDMSVASGFYTVVENTNVGFATTYDNCSQVFVPNSGTATCTITNTDKPGTLIVNKVVVNDDGGGAVASDFSFGIEGVENANFAFVNNQLDSELGSKEISDLSKGTYTIVEDEYEGYEMTSNTCVDVIVSNGQTTQCTITNDDKPGKLIIDKVLTNKDGGTADYGDFDYCVFDYENPDADCTYTDQLSDESIEINVPAGSYEVTEILGDLTDQYDVTYDNCYVDIANGETETCTITNDDIAPTLEIGKRVFNDNGGTVMADDFSLYVNDSLLTDARRGGGDVSDNGVWYLHPKTKANVQYTATEDPYDGYENTDFECIDTDTEGVVTHPVILSPGQKVTCTFTNDDISPTLTLEKVVINDNEGTETADAWTLVAQANEENPVIEETGLLNILTEENDAITDETDVMAGTFYTLSEAGPEGYDASDWDCDGGSQDGNGIVLQVGENVTCTITNDDTAIPTLTLEKFNNRPEPVARGEEVVYTLVVSVPELGDSIYGYDSCNQPVDLVQIQVQVPFCEYIPATVTDLPPENIDYVPGSWTANSNVRGDLKASGVTTEPTYASPGDWALTNSSSPVLVPGEIVTLTYRAKVGSNASNGVHPDTAFAIGYNITGDEEVLANESTGIFRSTDVEIVGAVAPQGFVLGASTLVVTGQNNLLQILIGLTLVLGTVYLARKTKGSKSSQILVAVGLVGVTMWMFTASASAASSFSVQTPESPTKSAAFTLAYQVLSTDSSADFESELFVNGVLVATDTITSEFGDSKAFNVTLPSDGTYDLKIVINETSGPDYFATETKTVVLDRSAPASPAFGGTTANGTEYTVRFTVPAGSDAQTVDVYASTQTTFSLTDATKRGTVAATPGTEQSITFTAPTSDRYYVAVVSRDNNGNASQAVGDSGVTIVPVAAAGGAGATGGAIQGATTAAAGQVEGETTGDGETPVNEQGEVAGEETTAEEESSSNSKTGWWILAGVLALIVGYYIYRSQMQSVDDDTKRNRKTK